MGSSPSARPDPGHKSDEKQQEKRSDSPPLGGAVMKIVSSMDEMFNLTNTDSSPVQRFVQPLPEDSGGNGGDTETELGACGVSDEGCADLTSALRSNPEDLKDLDLSGNKLGDSGVKSLSAVLENPHCKLETLWLCDCDISVEGCAALASALSSNPSHLRELNLSQNNLGDSGVKNVSALIRNPHCKLETLSLSNCRISDEGCAELAKDLKSNPSHLKELDLSQNNLQASQVRCLTEIENPGFKLDI